MDKMHCSDKREALSREERISRGGVEMVKIADVAKDENAAVVPVAPGKPVGFDINVFIDPSSKGTEQEISNVQVDRPAISPAGGGYGFSGNQFAGPCQWNMAGSYQNIAGLNSTAHTMEARQRRKRRSLASCSLQVMKNGLWLVHCYDNGDVEQCPILNLPGPVKIGGVQVLGSDRPLEYIFLSYENGTHYIFLPRNKKRNISLLEECQKQGICFNQFAKQDEIEGALKGFLAVLDERVLNESMLTVPALAGWFDGKFCDRSHPACSIVQTDLPIAKRSFSRVRPADTGIEAYIKEMQIMFPDPLDRILVAAWPVMGLISSLLRKHGVPIKAVLNLIPLGCVDQEATAGLMKVFNREKLDICDAGKPKRKIDDILDKCQDQVLSFDCRRLNNQHQRDLRKQTVDCLLRMVAENGRTCSGRNADFAVSILSDQYQPGAFNVFLPGMNEVFLSSASRLRESQGLEMVLTGVVNMIESSYEDAEMIFSRRQDGLDFRLVPIDIAVAFLREFFRRADHDLDEELALPEISDLAARLEDDDDSDERRLVLFVREIRNHARDWICEEKNYRTVYHEGTFYYDTNWLYFPVELLRDLFAEIHREALLPRVLVELRSKGMLITDGPNLTVKKVMLSSKRKDYYVFPTDLFNETGKAKIQELARNRQDDE